MAVGRVHFTPVFPEGGQDVKLRARAEEITAGP